MTAAEVRLWQRIRQRQLGLRFRRQQPIGPYIVDFYCARAKLIVEVDGDQHGSSQQSYDRQRDRWLGDQGYTVVRYWNNRVLEDTDHVVTELMVELEAALAGTGEAPSPNPSPGGEGNKQSAGR